MSLRIVLLVLALALQAGFGLAWAGAAIRARRSGEGLPSATPPGFPGRHARVLGLAGALAGLAHAALGRDPVFFAGQAMLLALAWRAAARRDGAGASGEPGPDEDGGRSGPGRNPG